MKLFVFLFATFLTLSLGNDPETAEAVPDYDYGDDYGYEKYEYEKYDYSEKAEEEYYAAAHKTGAGILVLAATMATVMML